MPRYIFKYLLVLVFISYISCTNSKREEQPVNSESKENSQKSDTSVSKIPPAGSVNGDTIYLSGKFVLFYAPAQDKDDATLKNFNENSAIVIDSLKKAGDLGVGFTNVTNIKIYLRTGAVVQFSTSGFADKKGVVVVDGLQPPTIKKGLLPVEEYHAFIKKYFMRP